MTSGMTTSKAEFSFRVWVHPEDGDPADIEVWYQGLESTEPGKRTTTDWIMESFPNEDFHRLFDLDTDKHWQVVGKGVLQVMYSLGEYDEEISIVEFSKAEVIECRRSARTRFPVVQKEKATPKVTIEFLQSVYDQMELMWYQINAEWGPAGDRLEQAIKDGREPAISRLRELISTGTSPQTDSPSPTISEHCNLDVENRERARVLHRVVRAMHDGHCPKCGF